MNNEPTKKPQWSPLRPFDWLFKWIKAHEDENQQRFLTGLVLAIVCGVPIWAGAKIWNNWDSITSHLAHGSKSFWNFLQFPIQLTVGIILIPLCLIFCGSWVAYKIRSKRENEGSLVAEIKRRERKDLEKNQTANTNIPTIAQIYGAELGFKANENETQKAQSNEALKRKQESLENQNIVRKLESEILDLKMQRGTNLSAERQIRDRTLYIKWLLLKETFDFCTSEHNLKQNNINLNDFKQIVKDFRGYFSSYEIELPIECAGNIESFITLLNEGMEQFALAFKKTNEHFRTIPDATPFNAFFEILRRIEKRFPILKEDFDRLVRLGTMEKESTPIAVEKGGKLILGNKPIDQTNIEITAVLAFLPPRKASLTVTVKNNDDLLAEINKVAIFLNPVATYRGAIVNEMTFPQPFESTLLNFRGATRVWELEFERKPDFILTERYGFKFGKGYIQLLSGDKREFEFKMLPDSAW